MKRYLVKMLTLAVLTTSIATPVFSDTIDDAIKARQSYYQLIKFNFGQLVAMVKGEAEYNAEAAQNAADNLKTISTLHIGPLYPKGSDNIAKKGKTRAQPNIWSDFAGVSEIGGKWRTAVGDLQSVASNGKDALAPAIGAIGAQCKACHEKYRAKDF